MAKNIDFKGLLNTVPYFFMWGECMGIVEKYVGGQWRNDNWTNMDN